MGPYIELTETHPWIGFLAAFIIGTGFGFALEQAGFSSSRKLAGMFYGYDTTVLKVFFTAAVVAMVGTSLLNSAGLLDMDFVFVNHFYVYASIVGGVIMGAGFIMGGFCPGTGISALSIGKVDALFFLLGGACGAFLFGELYPYLEKLYLGGNKGPVKLSDSLGISDRVLIFLVIIIAGIMFYFAEKVENKYRHRFKI